MDHIPQRRHSFGIVPLYKNAGGLEVLLILQSRLGPKVWGFPKGTPEEGETPLETAEREVREEIGCGDIALIPDFSHTEAYVFTEADATEVHKQVTYFAGYLASKEVTPQASEVDAYEWLPFREALERVTYPETKEVLEALAHRFKI